MAIQLINFAFTDSGDREYNEDYYDEITLEQGVCFIMADGCGAYGAGDFAAKVFCSTLLIEIKNHPLDKIECESGLVLKNFIEHVKAKMCEELKRVGHPEARTTCAMVWMDQHKMLTVHVGDTRVYRLSSKGTIWHTQDHASSRHTLLKSLGVSKPANATVQVFGPLQKDETIALCTDGFWEHVTSEEWRLLAGTPNLDNTFHNIKKQLLSLEANRDNMSAQVIRRFV